MKKTLNLMSVATWIKNMLILWILQTKLLTFFKHYACGMAIFMWWHQMIVILNINQSVKVGGAEKHEFLFVVFHIVISFEFSGIPASPSANLQEFSTHTHESGNFLDCF